VRIFRHHPVRLARALVVASVIAAAAGCAGGSSSSLPNSGSNQICDSNAGSISIARPTPGFPSNGNSIEIVSSSGSDDLHTSPNLFDFNVRDTSGNLIAVSSTLSLIPDASGPHPYTSDFFYQGNLSTGLAPGTYNLFLNAPSSNCTAGFVGTFSI
jgi:hypothetical protein